MTALIGTVLSGSDFKKIFTGPFYKFLNDNFIHYNFTYKIGLNIDNEQFNPTGGCQKGGLYFCEESKCHMYCLIYGRYLAQINVPDDAKVYIEKDKFKADRLIISTIIHFDNVTDECWINLLQNDSRVLKYVMKQTEELCD
jgi:hypothetical protein